MKLGIEQQRHHRQFGGGIGVRQAAADGAAVTDGKMRDMRHRAREHRKMFRDDGRGFDLVMPRQRADFDGVARVLDESEAGNSVDVDENRRTQQPEIQHRHQALPAGQDFRVTAGLRQRCNCLLDAVRNDVLERCWLHDCERPCTVPATNDFHN